MYSVVGGRVLWYTVEGVMVWVIGLVFVIKDGCEV